MKKLTSMIRLGGLVTALLLATGVGAIPINITVDSAGKYLNPPDPNATPDYNATFTPVAPPNGMGVANKTQYGSSNNNPDSNLAFLRNEIAQWNGASLSPSMPSASALALNQESLDGNSYHAVAGYEYVVFHFGAGNAGSSGGYWAAYYLGGAALDFSAVPQVAVWTDPVEASKKSSDPIPGHWDNQSVGGFSSARYYDEEVFSAADGGSTVALLGASLTGLSLLRRRFGGK